VGTYVGHKEGVTSAVELDDILILTGSLDGTLKVWNKRTCECLCSFITSDSVRCMIRSKDKSLILCGLKSGAIEMRRADDLDVISWKFEFHSEFTSAGAVWCICELEDGSFVSGSYGTMKRWDVNGTVLQTFCGPIAGHHAFLIVMELSSDIIVALSTNNTLTIWKLSTGKLLLTIPTVHIRGIVKLSDDKFVTGSVDTTIRVWNAMTGQCIETVSTDRPINAITRVGDSIVTASWDRIEVRKLKYVYFIVTIPFLILSI